MIVAKEQLELLNIEDDRAYFNVKGYDYSFEVAFDYKTNVIQAELDYFSGTGLLECTEVSFIDVEYISFLYDADNNNKGIADVSKSDLEDILKNKLESDLNN